MSTTAKQTREERAATLDRLGVRCRWITKRGEQCSFRYRQWQRGKGGPYCDRHAAMAGYSIW